MFKAAKRRVEKGTKYGRWAVMGRGVCAILYKATRAGVLEKERVTGAKDLKEMRE